MTTAATPDPRPTLLIADDDRVVCYALSAELQGSFCVVAVAGDAVEAAALAAEHRPAAALIDVDMPGGGARHAVPRIAECSPDTRVVILSADECDPVVRELLDAGAMAYLRKGLRGTEIAAALDRALRVPD